MRLKCKLSLCLHKPVHAGTHIRRWSGLWGHQYLVNFHWGTFLFFFLRAHKKHKNANRRISYNFQLRCFLSTFFIFVPLFAFLCFWLVAFLCFWCCLVLFGAFGAFSPVRNFFVKKKFKTTLITSIILLLNPSTALFLL